jgi:hypothetical protein
MAKTRQKKKLPKTSNSDGDCIVPPTLFKRNDTPGHLFNIPELDFSEDLFAERTITPWFRLGAWTNSSRRDDRGVENEIMRQSILLAPDGFAAVFDKLESIGNVFTALGKPSGMLTEQRGVKKYSYAPFDRFEFPFTPVIGEPLVFVHHDTSGVYLFINPDLWLFFELEERAAGNGIWWDPKRGLDVLVRRVIDQDSLQIVEIRADYLLKYLRARQMSLIVGHYRQLLLFNPPKDRIGRFVEEDLALGAPQQGAKAILQNWGLRQGGIDRTQFLQRRLHLWFEIKPPAINVDDPWADEPSFDPYTFTFPTSAGATAPARWKHFRGSEEHTFEGNTCDFMDRVYFRQEVLTKYEGAAGFDVKDDGSTSCRDYWGLVRSTARLGNELLSTAIGDFAEGVPFEEWPHWKQYAVEPPSLVTARTLALETPIPEAVNSLAKALERLNSAFADLSTSLGVTIADQLWRGSLDSLAARQLKWVYPTTADDDEFLKRATLASTFFIDGLQPTPLRELLTSVDGTLHKNFENPSQTLGSRNLLQRVTLVAALLASLRPELAELPSLVKQAEGKAKNAIADLQGELETLHQQVRDEFAPLAFLYDLRIHGGLAHPPNKDEAVGAAVRLGLPRGNWHRTDYLNLLRLVGESVNRISEDLEAAADMLARTSG